MASMESSILDYIHDHISLLDEDVPSLQNRFATEQVERLKGISHLGLVRKTHRLARHDKYEHAYGTYWLCRQCAELTQGLVERKSYFRLAGILHGIGHLPFSYDTEFAVAKLYYIHDETRAWLNGVLDAVVAFADHPSVTQAGDRMKASLNHMLLHRWFAAYKISKSETSELSNQKGKNIVRILVDAEHTEHQLLSQLDRIDFVLRDMLYLGFARLELTFAELLPQFRRDIDGSLRSPRIVSVIDTAYKCLCDQIYLGPRERSMSQILEKAVVAATVGGHIRAQDLLDMKDREMEDELSNWNSETRTLDDSVRRVNEGKVQQVCRLLCDLGNKPPVEIERRLAGTTQASFHKYHVGHCTYVQCLPTGYCSEMEGYEWSEEPGRVFIACDLESKRPEHVIGALLSAEKLAPENLYGLRMPCREEALQFLTGLTVRPGFDRYRVIRDVISRNMPKSKDGWDPELLFDEAWAKLYEDPVGELYWEYDIDWPVVHFLEFPEHWSTDTIQRVLSDVRRTLATRRRRRNETTQQYQARIDTCLEYSTYLETILRLRDQGLPGWVLPAVRFLDENEADRIEVDVCAIHAPKAHHGPVTLELHEMSRDDSQSNREHNRRKLENGMLFRVRDRFGRKIRVLGYFNEQEVLRWP